METEKLYYVDQFIQEFPATVLSCEAGKNGYQVVLDCTAFYPEGGGQPADHGTLGSVHVTDVHEKDGVIFHTCDGPVEIGQMVNGRIDWARRFDHMQQHSGELLRSVPRPPGCDRLCRRVQDKTIRWPCTSSPVYWLLPVLRLLCGNRSARPGNASAMPCAHHKSLGSPPFFGSSAAKGSITCAACSVIFGRHSSGFGPR